MVPPFNLGLSNLTLLIGVRSFSQFLLFLLVSASAVSLAELFAFPRTIKSAPHPSCIFSYRNLIQLNWHMAKKVTRAVSFGVVSSSRSWLKGQNNIWMGCRESGGTLESRKQVHFYISAFVFRNQLMNLHWAAIALLYWAAAVQLGERRDVLALLYLLSVAMLAGAGWNSHRWWCCWWGMSGQEF